MNEMQKCSLKIHVIKKIFAFIRTISDNRDIDEKVKNYS